MKKCVLVLMLAIVLLTAGCAKDDAGQADFAKLETAALSESEMTYLEAQTTNTWLDMSDTEKSDFVVLIGRWLEASEGYIVEDYDEFQFMLNRQMEQYFRYSVDESVTDTVLDILDLE